jgi:hypothetical protein
MYTLQEKTRYTRHVRIRRAVHICGNLSQAINSVGWTLLLLRKKGSRHHSLPDWVICRSATQFLFQDNHWSSNESQASINNRLHRFAGPITFNTCSRGPAHQSLSDTGGGYNLKGVGLPHTTPRPFQPTVSTFHLSASPGLRLSIINISL